LADCDSSKQAELEKSRYQKRNDTVLRMRYAPFPWRDKAKRLLATKAQATFAQGTHTFSLTDDVLTKIRSNIMRAMFSVDFFSMRYFYRRNWIPTSATYTKV